MLELFKKKNKKHDPEDGICCNVCGGRENMQTSPRPTHAPSRETFASRVSAFRWSPEDAGTFAQNSVVPKRVSNISLDGNGINQYTTDVGMLK